MEGIQIDSPHQGLVPLRSITSTPKPNNPSGSSSTTGSPDLASYFCDSPSGPSLNKLEAIKRTNTPANESSPESVVDSPSKMLRPIALNRVLEKTVSTNGPGLFGGRVVQSSRKMQPYKRPTLMTLASIDGIPRPAVTAALPKMESSTASASQATFKVPVLPRPGMGGMRRAYSVCTQTQGVMDSTDGDTDVEDSPSTSKNGGHGPRVVSHVETGPGTGFQSIKHLGGRITPDTSVSDALALAKGKQGSPYVQAGFLGFGENELDGKILPCHKVKEDGLVRITPETVCYFLFGSYESVACI